MEGKQSPGLFSGDSVAVVFTYGMGRTSVQFRLPRQNKESEPDGSLSLFPLLLTPLLF